MLDKEFKKSFAEQYDLNEVANFCYTHSNKEVFEKYNVEYSVLKKDILIANGLHPTKEQTSNRRRLTCIERYGVANVYQSSEVKEKKKQTYLDKYGVENPSQLEEVKRKKEQTSLKNYGVKYHKQTNATKHKLSEIHNDKDFQEKVKQHNIEKYGVESTNQLEEVKKKKEETSLKNYGVKYTLQSEELREKIRQTSLEKYGVESPSQSEEAISKRKQTCIEKYGVGSYSQTDEYRKKIEQTCLERYGVPYYCMVDNCRNTSNGYHSKPNEDFAKLLADNNIEFTREFPINKYSYDFKVGNILIEINPTITHNSTIGFKRGNPTDPLYHQNKTITADDNGYRVIHIFDWDDTGKIIELLKSRKTIYARECDIRKVSIIEERTFLNNHHLQKFVKSSICYGLYYNDELVSLMSFGKPRYNKNYEYELLRYCSSYYIVGGEEKLWKHFIDDYKPNSVVSYCDLSKFTGNVYKKLGFTSSKKIPKPSKHWYNILTKQHITDNLLRQRGFDQLFGADFGKGTSNEELMIEHNFLEVYDCGQAKFIWRL